MRHGYGLGYGRVTNNRVTAEGGGSSNVVRMVKFPRSSQALIGVQAALHVDMSEDLNDAEYQEVEDDEARSDPPCLAPDLLTLCLRRQAVPSGPRTKKAKPGKAFESFNLHPPIYAALRRKGYRLPTPVQRKAVPLIMAGASAS